MLLQRWDAKICRKEKSPQPGMEVITTRLWVQHAHHWATWAGHTREAGSYHSVFDAVMLLLAEHWLQHEVLLFPFPKMFPWLFYNPTKQMYLEVYWNQPVCLCLSISVCLSICVQNICNLVVTNSYSYWNFLDAMFMYKSCTRQSFMICIGASILKCPFL